MYLMNFTVYTKYYKGNELQSVVVNVASLMLLYRQ